MCIIFLVERKMQYLYQGLAYHVGEHKMEALNMILSDTSTSELSIIRIPNSIIVKRPSIAPFKRESHRIRKDGVHRIPR